MSFGLTLGLGTSGGASDSLAQFSPLAEWDSSRASNVTLDGDNATQIEGIRGGYVATASSGEQPDYTAEIFSQKVLTFDGTDDYMQVSYDAALFPEALSGFIVFENLNASPNFDGVISFGTANDNRFVIQFDSTNGNLTVFNDITGGNVNVDSAIDVTSGTHIIYFEISDAGTTIQVDDETPVTSAVTNNNLSDLSGSPVINFAAAIAFGGGVENEANMRQAHVVLFDRILSSGDKAGAGLVLARKWNLPYYGYDRLPVSQLNNLTTEKAIPSNFTFSRASTGTYYDSDGVLQTATTNTPRFDHEPFTGRSLGLLCENAKTNLHHYSQLIDPDTASGFYSNAGFQYSHSTISDPEGGTAARQWNATSSSGSKNIRSSGHIDYANGTTYTWSVFVKPVNWSLFRLVVPWNTNLGANFDLTGSGEVGVSSSGVIRHSVKRLPNDWFRLQMTATADADYSGGRGWYLALISDSDVDTTFQTIPAVGDDATNVARVGLFGVQTEAGSFASSYIVTTGAATAARSRDIFADSGISSELFFSEDQGTIAVRCSTFGIGNGSNAYAIECAEGVDFNDYYSMYFTSNNNKAHFQSEQAGSGQGNVDLSQGAVLDMEQPIGFSFGDNEIDWFSGGNTDLNNSITQVTGIDRFYLGSSIYSNSLYGHIQKIYISDKRELPKVVTAKLYSSIDKGGIGGGQSNMEGWFGSSVSPGRNYGERQAIETMREFGDATNPFIVNGATNGSAAIGDSITDPTGNWWYDPDEDVFGSAYDKWEAAAQGFINGGGTLEFMLWDQGESDSAQAEADYYAAVVAIFAKQRTIVGNLPIFIIPIGHKSTSDSYQSIRNAQRDLATNLSAVYLCPEKFDVALGDTVHLSDAGYTTVAERTMKFVFATLGYSVTSPIYAPQVASVSRSGTSVTVNITHGSGSDISPSTGIEGFVYQKTGAVDVTINAAVRTDADTITLTLNEDVAGTLYYGFQAMHTIDPADLVVDDNGYPLQSFTEVVA